MAHCINFLRFMSDFSEASVGSLTNLTRTTRSSLPRGHSSILSSCCHKISAGQRSGAPAALVTPQGQPAPGRGGLENPVWNRFCGYFCSSFPYNYFKGFFRGNRLNHSPQEHRGGCSGKGWEKPVLVLGDSIARFFCTVTEAFTDSPKG